MTKEGGCATDWRAIQRELAVAHAGPESGSLAWRATQVAIAALLLVATLPVMLAIAAIIRLDSPGPALFRQVRVGRAGRLFRFTKFRTLHADAAARFPELYAYRYAGEEIERLRFKVPDDPRLTRAGRWLRRTSLDELPNLWHVVTGEMALVGPRPEIPEMLPYYSAQGRARFAVRPGVTGLAEVSGRGDLTFREAESYDADYARRASVRLDLAILARTHARERSRATGA